MINERLAAAARTELSSIAGDQWDQFRSEIQDNGTFVLLMARVPYGEPAEVSADLKQKVIAALNALVPQHPAQTAGSWQLNVYRGAALVDSIFPDER